jgi:hypothetical protein
MVLETEMDYHFPSNPPVGPNGLQLDPSVIQMNQADHYNLPLDNLKEMKEKALISMKLH